MTQTQRKDYRSSPDVPGFTSSEDRNAQLRSDMERMMVIVEENSVPEKRWWHFFVKPKQEAVVIHYEEDTMVLSEQDRLERRAFLDGYSEGRKDGDAHKAYKLWRKMMDHNNT